MIFNTSICLIEHDASQITYEQHQIALDTDLDYTRLYEIYSLGRNEVESLLAVKTMDQICDDSLAVFPVAKFELELQEYHVLLYGKCYFKYLVCQDINGFMLHHPHLTEALNDLDDSIIKTQYREHEISLYSLMVNYIQNYEGIYRFNEYLCQPLIDEECRYIDLIEY